MAYINTIYNINGGTDEYNQNLLDFLQQNATQIN